MNKVAINIYVTHSGTGINMELPNGHVIPFGGIQPGHSAGRVETLRLASQLALSYAEAEKDGRDPDDLGYASFSSDELVPHEEQSHELWATVIVDLK